MYLFVGGSSEEAIKKATSFFIYTSAKYKHFKRTQTRKGKNGEKTRKKLHWHAADTTKTTVAVVYFCLLYTEILSCQYHVRAGAI